MIRETFVQELLGGLIGGALVVWIGLRYTGVISKRRK